MVPRLAALCLLSFAAGARGGEGLTGSWATPLGTIVLTQTGDAVEGRLARPPARCALKQGAVALKAELLEDSLSGQLLPCLAGCKAGSDWVPALLLVAPGGRRLAGALTLPKGCRPAVPLPAAFVALREPAAGGALDVAAPLDGRRPRTQPRPLAAERAPLERRPVARVLPEPDPALRAQAHALAADGAAFLDEGRFEKARERFQEAVKVDPTYAEGYNGIGATFRARNDLAEALRFYKRSVEADPAVGDAYYNLACVYALQGKRALALRYLRTARRNGYVAAGTMARDGDLASLHGDPAFRVLLEGP